MQKRPRLVLNTSILNANLQRMVEKTNLMSIELRPHVKTIHDPGLSEHLKAAGITKICVSNLDMLKSFITAGWRDICLAVPCPLSIIPELQQLLNVYDDLKLMLYIDHEDQLNTLLALETSVACCIEIDSGQHRSGIDWKQEHRLIDLINEIKNSHHHFAGLSSHFGFLYHCENKATIISESSKTMMKILQLKEHLDAHFSEPVLVSIGDTPSFLAMSYFDNVYEIRAGNFMLNDLTISDKGLCETHDIACAIEAVVISKSEQDSRFVLHCGSVHLAKEIHDNPTIRYGLVAKKNNHWCEAPLESTYIDSLNQEHAVVFSSPQILKSIHLGDQMFILPVHSCLAMDAMYYKNSIHYISE